MRINADFDDTMQAIEWCGYDQDPESSEIIPLQGAWTGMENGKYVAKTIDSISSDGKTANLVSVDSKVTSVEGVKTDLI